MAQLNTLMRGAQNAVSVNAVFLVSASAGTHVRRVRFINEIGNVSAFRLDRGKSANMFDFSSKK